MFDRLLERLCERVAARLPKKVIPRPDGEPYLIRYYLLGREDRPFNAFLHLFVCGDVESELHCHPWETSFSLILTGGYREERRIGRRVVQRLVKPLTINVIRSDDYHRVDLLKDRAWTLFVAVKPKKTWFFWDRDTNKTTWWLDFINQRPHRQAAEA
jgi:hypothetical protein